MTYSHLIRDLTARGAMMNAFGPSADGDAMLEAADAIRNLRIIAAEFAEFARTVTALLAQYHALTDETGDRLREAYTIMATVEL